jgi:hypothetical protein
LKISGNSRSLDVFLDQNTVANTERAYFSRKSEFIGWKDAIKSVFHMFLGIYSSAIRHSWRNTVITSENIIRKGSELIVKGILGKNSESVYIKPEYLTGGTDIDLLQARRRLTVSFKLFCIFGLIWAAGKVYIKAKRGEWRLFSKNRVVNNSEAQTSDCIICLTYPRDVVFEPCKHLAVCSLCMALDSCPICRAKVNSVNKLVFVD